MVGLGQEGFARGWGGTTLKDGRTEERGGDTKIFKMGGKLSQGVGALKRGAGTPVQTMGEELIYGD